MTINIYQRILRFTCRPEEKGEYSSGYWQNRVRQEALSLTLTGQGRLLEIGCGEGLFLAQSIRQNPKLQAWGIDNDATRLSAAKARLPKAELSQQDALKLSFPDRYFDRVVCINLLFNLSSLEALKQVLKEARRVCKKEGRIIFDFRNALNPLLWLKYRLARYYDPTLRGLPLRTYFPKQIQAVLRGLDLTVAKERLIGFNLGIVAPVIVYEVKIND